MTVQYITNNTHQRLLASTNHIYVCTQVAVTRKTGIRKLC